MVKLTITAPKATGISPTNCLNCKSQTAGGVSASSHHPLGTVNVGANFPGEPANSGRGIPVRTAAVDGRASGTAEGFTQFSALSHLKRGEGKEKASEKPISFQKSVVMKSPSQRFLGWMNKRFRLNFTLREVFRAASSLIGICTKCMCNETHQALAKPQESSGSDVKICWQHNGWRERPAGGWGGLNPEDPTSTRHKCQTPNVEPFQSDLPK